MSIRILHTLFGTFSFVGVFAVVFFVIDSCFALKNVSFCVKIESKQEVENLALTLGDIRIQPGYSPRNPILILISDDLLAILEQNNEAKSAVSLYNVEYLLIKTSRKK